MIYYAYMKYVIHSIVCLLFLVPQYTHAQSVDTGDDRVDVLWEVVDAYTPPFYKGKALPVDQSSIRAVAVSGSFNPRTTTYTWTRNGKQLSRAGGVNKSSLVFTHDILQNTETVGVSLAAGGTVADGSASTQITPATPFLVLYEKRDGFIDYTKGYTDTFAINYPGTTIRIEPFFFSIMNTIQNSIEPLFTLGGNNPEIQNDIEIPLVRPKDSGTTTLRSEFNSKRSDWQSASLQTTITF